MSLEGLGLTAQQSAAYEAVIVRSPVTAEDLLPAHATDLAGATDLLAELEARGLVVRSGSDGRRYVASPPALALGALVLARHEELRRSELVLDRLAEAYRGAASSRTAADVVDVVTGRHAVAQRFSQLQAGAQHEVQAFVRAGVLAVAGEDNLEEERAVERGVRYRVLVESTVLERPGFLAEVQSLQAQGGQLRVAAALPCRLIVADGALAMLPISPTEDDRDVSALLVHASPLLDLVVELFECRWEQGRPLLPADDDLPGSALPPLDARILTLLDAGLTDRAVATQLGLSMRTVQRRVRALMDLARVDTRFRLGVESARRGWTGSTRNRVVPGSREG